MLLKSESVCKDKVLGLGQMKIQKSICEIYLWVSIHLQSKTGVGQPSERPLESIISRLAVQTQMKSMIVGSSRRSISVKRVGWHDSGPLTEQSRAEASTSQSEKWKKKLTAVFSQARGILRCYHRFRVPPRQWRKHSSQSGEQKGSDCHPWITRHLSV